MSAPLIDSHCHLDFPDFETDLDDVLARAREAGVTRFLTICTHVSKFDQVRHLAETHDTIHCTVGIHPHNAETEPDVDAAQLIAFAEHPKVAGFGETGLDYFYDRAPREIQKRQFRAHIKAARQTGLPVVIHTRDADADMAEILTEEMGKGAFPGLLHCFSSGPELARTAVDLGLYISLSGIVTFNKAEDLRGIIRGLPVDRLLVETDCPYLAPVPRRGKRNEPAFVAYTAEKLAEIMDMSVEDMARATTANFYRLFGAKIPAPSDGAAA